MNIFIDFGGFYHSWHDDICERAVAYQLGADNEYGEIDRDNDAFYQFNGWDEVHAQYADQWLDMLNNELGTKIHFIGVSSPRFYNYQTDKIAASISQRDQLTIMRFIRENDLKTDLMRVIKDQTTSRDGYCPFYSYKNIFQRDNWDLLIQMALQVINEYLSADYPFVLDEFYPDISEVAV